MAAAQVQRGLCREEPSHDRSDVGFALVAIAVDEFVGRWIKLGRR